MHGTEQSSLVNQFHTLYYDSREQTWGETYWLGRHTLKCPFDLWIYQEILYELRPELIIETGTYLGGSSYFLASICDLLGGGEVVTIDSERQPNLPEHARITYLTGSSTSAGILRQVTRRAKRKSRVMVILDSGHSRDHVLAEMEVYGPLVTPGSSLIVEDTNLNGHPVERNHGPGPAEAVETFLAQNAGFTRDESREKLMLTFNPGGYLRKRETAKRNGRAARSPLGRLWHRLRPGRQQRARPRSTARARPSPKIRCRLNQGHKGACHHERIVTAAHGPGQWHGANLCRVGGRRSAALRPRHARGLS